MELLSSSPNTMHKHWKFIEAASKGNLEMCKFNAPTKAEYIKNTELLSIVYEMALHLAISGRNDDVVIFLVYHRINIYDSTVLNGFEKATVHEYVSNALEFASQNGKTHLLRKIRDVIGPFIFPPAIDCVIGRASGKAGQMLDLKDTLPLLVALTEAVRHDHREMAMAIVLRINEWHSTERSLMFFCAYKDQPDLLKLLYQLLPASAQEDWWQEEILTPLYLAAKAGSQVCSQLALQYWGSHVDINALYFPERFSALHVAAYYGHEDVVCLLLQQSSINLQVKDALGRTPLHYASWGGHLSVVLQLLQKLGPMDDNANNVSDDNGVMPLHLAICAGHTEVVRELLNRSGCSADYVRRKAAKDYTFQNLNSLFNFQRLSPDLSIPQPKDTVFSNVLTIGELYEPPNLTDSVFWSPGAFTSLHFAAALSHPEVLQHVLTFFCHEELDDVLLLKDNMGLTAYEWAQARGLGEVFLRCVEAFKGKEFVGKFTKKVGSTDAINRSLNLLKEMDRFEQRKREMKWCMDICQALREHKMDVARQLVYQVECQKINIPYFGQPISQALLWHIFPTMTSFEPSSVAYRLSVKCMVDGISRNDIEGLMLHLCQVAEFTSDVLERWLQQAVVFGFHDLAYHLIAREKVNCNTAIDITYLMAPRMINLPPNGLLSAFKLAVMWKQRRMQRWMAEQDDVKRGLYEDRQVYVDYANTILVGAVLIAGVAYQGWLQPPSGFDEDGYALVDQHSSSLKVFWWLNNINFFLSVATVIAAGLGAMPASNNEHLVDAVTRVHSAVSVASILFLMSMVCIMAAFATSGITILPHHSHTYQLIMKVTVSLGALLCFPILVWFTKRLFDLNPNYKSALMLKKTVKKGTSLLIGFCVATIFLCCIGLPCSLILGPLLLVWKLAKLCACSRLEETLHTAINIIANYVWEILCFLDYHSYMAEFISFICDGVKDCLGCIICQL